MPRPALPSSLLLLTLLALAAAAAEPGDGVAARLAAMHGHPRLFLAAADEAELKRAIAADPLLAAASKLVIAEADGLLAAAPVQRTLIGRRLLDKSRTCLHRVVHLAFAWRLTGDAKYLARARAEMLAAAAFADWNPSHFLDVAEMTAALAIGYDWLHPALDAETRATIRAAIVAKGLTPSQQQSGGWVRGINNWNQVCHAGTCLGALAVYEDEPALATALVQRAVECVPNSMREYAPDGAYPEGPGYWGYGTSFNVLMISALEAALGTDFGLTAQPGFLATADYLLQVAGPTGLFFNYSDSGNRSGVQPAMYWFAARRAEPTLLWSEQAKLRDLIARGGHTGDRLFPFLLIWSKGALAPAAQPAATSWKGGGATPVAMHRSGWDAAATFVAIKGGSASTNHAHMDVGSFVMDADGQRWADDLGMQDYNSLESKGVNLWNEKQDSQRWKVFRIGPSAHNILQVDGQRQLVAGKAPIVASAAGHTVIDLGSVYAGQLGGARRGVRLRADRSVLVQDELTGGAKPATVRWAMLTRATVRVDGTRAILEQNGKRLVLTVLEPAGATLRTYATEAGPSDFDAPNPGTCMVGFETALPAAAAQRLAVRLAPGDGVGEAETLTPLAAW